MMKTTLAFLPLAALALLASCDAKPKAASATPIPEPVAKTNTLETRRLGAAIDAFDREATASHEADVKKAVADLDSEIAELQAREAKTSGGDRDEAEAKRRNLQSYRDTEVARFELMRAKAAVLPTTPDARSAADKLEDGARRAGNTLEDAGKQLKDTVKDATR